MKKVISVLVLGLLIAFPLLADGSWTNVGADGTTSPILTDGTNQKAQLTASFDIKNDINDQVEVGFTSADLSSNFSIATEIEDNTILKDAVALKDTDGDGIATSKEGNPNLSITAYAKVTSNNKINVTLSIDSPMKTSSNDYLGWKVTMGGTDLELTDTQTNDASASQPLLNHVPNESKISAVASQVLTISTHDYREKKPGTYEGNIYITVTADATGMEG